MLLNWAKYVLNGNILHSGSCELVIMLPPKLSLAIKCNITFLLQLGIPWDLDYLIQSRYGCLALC